MAVESNTDVVDGTLARMKALRDGDLWSDKHADSLAFQLDWSDCQVIFKSFIEVEYQKLDDVINQEAIGMINEVESIMAAAKPYLKRGRMSDQVDQFLTAMDDKDKGVYHIAGYQKRLQKALTMIESVFARISKQTFQEAFTTKHAGIVDMIAQCQYLSLIHI